MLKDLKVMLVFSLIISLFISCTEDMQPVLPDEPTVEVPQQEDENENVGNKPGGSSDSSNSSTNNNQNAYEVGNGSGNVVIDGNEQSFKGKSFILIKAGTYGTITIKNLKGNINSPIVIKNSGEVFVSGSMNTDNLNNVTIAGDNVSGLKYGFNFHNVNSRAINMENQMNGVTLSHMSFKNIEYNAIYGHRSNGTDLRYQGTSSSRNERFKILYCSFENTGNISFGGYINENEDSGFFKDVEIAYNYFSNTGYAGNAVDFTNVQDYDIHHNMVDNFNKSNNNHNGVFFMTGNGKFHDNKLTNYQGNALRAWVFSRGSTPATIEIFNNIMYNSRKYGAFEIQGFEKFYKSGKTTHVNAKVYNNTAGKMNTSNDWAGVMLDVYNYGGTLEFFNNLGFEMQTSGKATINSMLNDMSTVPLKLNNNNKYFNKASEAVSNDFKSLHSGTGAKL